MPQIVTQQPYGAVGLCGTLPAMVKRQAKKAHFIKEWRKYRGLTQDGLADKIGYDRTYISKIEKGNKRYDQPFLEAAAAVLGCKPYELIMRDPLAPHSIWSLWDQISAADREAASKMLEGLVKKTSTEG